MALETGDVKRIDPNPPPISDDDTSPEVTTSYRDPNVPDPKLTPVPSIIASLIPDVPDIPGGIYGDVASSDVSPPSSLSASSDQASELPNIASLSQLLPTPEQIQKFRQSEIGAIEKKIGLEGQYAANKEERDRDFYRTMRSKYMQESASTQDLKPWNPQTMAPSKTPLMEQFGSLGFIVAMVGSAFTAMPMVSALNSGAAAMNAINQGDLDAYNRAFDEWKVNTDLVLKRHNLIHAEMEDIGQLWDKDQVAAKSRLETYLTQINDGRKLNALRMGMDKEVWDAVDAETSAVERITKLIPSMMEQKAVMDATQQGLRQGKDLLTALTDAERKVYEAKQAGRFSDRTTTGRLMSQAQERWTIWDRNNPQQADESDADYERRREIAHDDITRDVFSATKPVEEKKSEISRFRAEEEVRHHKEQERLGQEKSDIGWARERELERHNAAVEMEKQYGGALSGNRRDKLQAQVNAYDNALDDIKDLKERIRKYHYSVGAAGKAMRVGERFADVVAGSKQADRVQIMRDLERLKLSASRLLLDAEGRPLAVSEHRIDDIIGGGSYGDLTVNTLKSLDTLEDQYGKMRKQHQKRLEAGPHVDIGEPKEEKEETPKDSEDAWDKFRRGQ
jgi:hypothetical protein